MPMKVALSYKHVSSIQARSPNIEIRNIIMRFGFRVSYFEIIYISFPEATNNRILVGMKTSPRHGLWFHLFDVLLNIVIIVGVVAVIRTFLVSPFQVEGNSMLSTLEHKEYIIINKLAYHIGSPNRGDVVVFRPPNDPKRPYVKRIMGVPGDRIVIENGVVFIRPEGSKELVEIDEEYLNIKNVGKTFQAPPSSGNTDFISYTVPEGHYFMLGDNRQGSLDSRSFRDESGDPIPYVEEDNVLGKVWMVALPISKIHALEPPLYDL